MRPPRPPIGSTILDSNIEISAVGIDVYADVLARKLRRARDGLTLPLCDVALAFVRLGGWKPVGYGVLNDYTREMLDRSQRWVQNAAALGKIMEALPRLRAAVMGSDGGEPLGSVAALCLGRIATASTLEAWIAYARSVSVRELRDAIVQARASRMGAPPGYDVPEADSASSATSAPAAESVTVEDDDPDDGERCRVSIPVPDFVLHVFDEVRDLFGAVNGRDTGPTALLEACLGESCSGPRISEPTQRRLDALVFPGDERPQVESIRVGKEDAVEERALCRANTRWEWLRSFENCSFRVDEDTRQQWNVNQLLIRSEDLLDHIRAVGMTAGQGGPWELHAQLVRLVRLETAIDRLLGRHLVLMSQRGAWRELGFASVAHYAEERLGMSRSTAIGRTRLARALRKLPAVEEAYDSGRLGQQNAFLLCRILGDKAAADDETSKCWVTSVYLKSVKRHRDEVRAIERAALDAAPGPAPAADGRAARGACPALERADATAGPVAFPRIDPNVRLLDDATWMKSLERCPGSALERIERWSAGFVAAHENGALPCSNVFIDLRLRRPLVQDVVAEIDAWYLRVADAATDLGDPAANRARKDLPLSEDLGSMAAVRVARLFVGRGCRPPRWVGFLAFLEYAVRSWDDPALHTRRAAENTYRKAGWRCMAPGCTVRRNLEEHHIQYGWGRRVDAPYNVITLCRFHHQQGEHGLFMSCRGRMPLGVVFRLGLPEFATWYQNERIVDPLETEFRSDEFGPPGIAA